MARLPTGPLGLVPRSIVMNIVVTYESNVTAGNFPNAGDEAAFKNAVSYVVNLYESLFTNNVTLDLNVGWAPLGPGVLGDNGTTNVTFSYQQVKAALVATANASGDPAQIAADATLPANDPLGGEGEISLTAADAAAIGLLPATSPVNAYLNIASNVSWSFAPLVTPPAGETYVIGTIEHELSEMMGRVSKVGTTTPKPMDLFRYAAPGVRATALGPVNSVAYFSYDQGNTNLGDWHNSLGGDAGDWHTPYGPAPTDAFGGAGTGSLNPITTTDVTLMNILGWDTAFPPDEVPGGVTDWVAAGETVSGVRVLSDGVVEVASGGKANGTVVSSGGTLELLGGAVENGTTVKAGGTLELGPGYSQSDLVVKSGATLLVDSGGVATDATISRGGTLTISGLVSGAHIKSGGTAAVDSGGALDVLSGDVVNGVTIDSGGHENVSSGGTTIGTVVSSGGRLELFEGATVSHATILSGGRLELFGSATASSTTIEVGGTLEFGSGHSQTGYVVSSGFNLEVASGGTADGTVVSSGGKMALLADATESGTTIKAGGTLKLGSGYVQSDFVVKSGVSLEVLNGGSATAVTVSRGGILAVSGLVSGADIKSGANAIVDSGGVLDVLSGEVRHELLIAVREGVEDQAHFFLLASGAELLGCEKHAKFQGHVESRQPRRCVRLRAANVVDAVLTIGDDPSDLLEPHLACVIDLQGTSGPETAIEDGEDHSLEKRRVLVVEGAIEKHPPCIVISCHPKQLAPSRAVHGAPSPSPRRG